MAKTNIGLVAYAKEALNRKCPYWLGGFGQKGSEDLFNRYSYQYPSTYNAQTKPSYVKQYGQFVHDCCGLIKGYFWKDTFDSAYKYESNGLPDINEGDMFKKCKETGLCTSIPEIQGLLVFKFSSGSSVPYHVGVYIGNGTVIEAKGHDYGTVTSNIKEWNKWGKFPYLTYESTPTPTPVPTPAKTGNVLNWQKAAIADGFKFPKYGADGEWGAECESVAKQDLIQQWPDGKYRYKNTTKLAQQLMGMPANKCDGLCGPETTQWIKTYQSKNGLKADGGIGLGTWKKLLKV